MSDHKQVAKEKVARLKAAINLESVDRVPLVGMADFWPVGYSGSCTMQEAYYDIDVLAGCYKKVFSRWNQWDSFGAIMQPLGPLMDATGSKRYRVPGRDLPADAEFQYPDWTLMEADEYPKLIDDPMGFQSRTVIPRLCTRLGSDDAYVRTIALAKALMFLGQYGAKSRFYSALWNDDYGIPPLFQGFSTRVPLDWIADSLRGFQNGILDVKERTSQVQSACEALLPFLRDISLLSSVPGGYPLLFNPQHVSPFLSPKDYEKVYWPTFKKLMDEFVEHGHRVWVFFENRQDHHLERLQDLPKGKIVAHLETTDLSKAKKALGGKLCIAGGMPTKLLARGTPQEVHEHTASVLKLFEDEPGFIMTTDAPIPPTAKPENIDAWMSAMTEHGRRGGSLQTGAVPEQSTASVPAASQESGHGREPFRTWSAVRPEFGDILGDENIIATKWEELEKLAFSTIYWLIR